MHPTPPHVTERGTCSECGHNRLEHAPEASGAVFVAVCPWCDVRLVDTPADACEVLR